jgi:hypothetical protein
MGLRLREYERDVAEDVDVETVLPALHGGVSDFGDGVESSGV